MPYASGGGVDLWFEDSGAGEDIVVFLHAASGSSESWRYQVLAFAEAGFRCIVYDRRTTGRSRVDASATPSTGSEDLRFLVDFLAIDRFHLVGTAAGGAVAIDYALGHRDRVRSLVVASSFGGLTDPEIEAFRSRVLPKEVSALPWAITELSAGYRGANPGGAEEWSAVLGRALGAGARHPVAQASRHTLNMTALRRLSMPVLLLVGGADLVTPPALIRRIAAVIPAHEVVVVPEAGHAAFWECPAEWNRAVVTFLVQH